MPRQIEAHVRNFVKFLPGNNFYRIHSRFLIHPFRKLLSLRMYKLLILPLLVFISATLLPGQEIHTIFVPPLKNLPRYAPEMICNDAGTVARLLRAPTTKSNDVTRLADTIYLCTKDSVFIDHTGTDIVLSGDPNTTTQAGIGYIFYKCPPYVSGPTLNAITQAPQDTCLWPGATNLLFITRSTRDGDIWFSNSGTLTTDPRFGGGKPVLIHFAPATVDDITGPEGRYESTTPGVTPPGPCVNVRVDKSFKVVYLTPITASGLTATLDGNDCLGRFRVSGGLPEWRKGATYTVDIFLESDPKVKAVIYTRSDQFFHNADIVFSVPRPGNYRIIVRDGKSCELDKTTSIDMGACTPADNVSLQLPELDATPGGTVCVPVRAKNFRGVSGYSFSVNWNPQILRLRTQPGLTASSAFDLNSAFARNDMSENIDERANGRVAIIYFGTTAQTLPDSAIMFSLCFDVLGKDGECTAIKFGNNPSAINFENATGGRFAVDLDTGRVCARFVPFRVQYQLVDTTCDGSARIRVTVQGGVPPYDVIYQNLPAGANRSGTIATSGGNFITQPVRDTLSIRVRDDRGTGNNNKDTTLILNLRALGASLDVTQEPKCFNAKNGIVAARVSLGGVTVPNPGAAYTFTWQGPDITQPTAPIQPNAGAGAYSVTIRQVSTGCTAVASGTLSQPARLGALPPTITPAACTGVQNGAIVYTASGGTPKTGGNYDYNWAVSEAADGTQRPFRTGSTAAFNLSNIGPGFYHVTITDANGCSFTDTREVTASRVVDVQLTQTSVRCFGGADGVVRAIVRETPRQPNARFTFSWNNGTQGRITSTDTSSNLGNMIAGLWSVTATDAAGCRDTASIRLTSPERLTFDTVRTTLRAPSCLLQNDGAITVSARGGTGVTRYRYRWNTTNPSDTTGTLSNLVPGRYQVTVTDVNGCRDSLTFALRLPSPPAIQGIDSVAVKCGSDGCLTVRTQGASGFLWRRLSDGDTVATTAQACRLPGGIYSVAVRDSRNCINIDTVSLGGKDTLRFTDTTFTAPRCFGDKNGSIGITVGGGTPVYTYRWSANNQTNSVATTIGAGRYTVTVSDRVGCTLTGNFNLSNPPRIAVLFQDIAGAACQDSCTGRARVEVAYADTSGQLRPGDFRFSWRSGNSTDSIRINLCAGFNSVTVTDRNNCFVTDSVSIDAPPAIATDSLLSTPTTCFGGNNGTATVLGKGGIGGPYTYSWSNREMASNLAGLRAGTYTVTISDRNGCKGTFSTTVAQPDSMVIEQNKALSTGIVCFGDDSGTVAVTVMGGNPGTRTYAWQDAAGTAIGNTISVGNIKAGIYSVTVTDAKSCTGVLTNIELRDPAPVRGSFEPWKDIKCNGDETTLNIDTIFGGNGGPYQYSLDFGVQLNANFPVKMDGGIHYVTYFDRLGCKITDTIDVKEPDAIVVRFDPEILEVELGDSVKLVPIITPNASVVDTFFWSPGKLLRNERIIEPQAYTFDSETFILTVFDKNGCPGKGQVRVEVDANRNVYIPNAFTPDNPRGLNDHFNPKVGKGIDNVNYFRVYNRWGALLYSRDDFFPNNDDFSEGWDGTYRGKFVEPGVYVYIVEVKFLDGRTLLYRGDITVAR